MKYFWLILIALVVVGGCRRSGVEGEYNGTPPDRLVLMRLHNEIRFDRGLQDLQHDEQLDAAAQKHAEWMASVGRLSHTGEGRSTVGERVGSGWRTYGENIAYGQRTEREVMDDWMGSTGHRQNILNKGFVRFGVGIAQSKNGTWYWCVDFGTRS
jgi:uncharacterized protein YkwD